MEEWTKIIFNTLYSVSTYGRVRNDKTGRILSQRPDKKGYHRANLKGKDYKVHRLVAIAFIENPKPDEYDQVNHIDGIKSNNHVSNLEWCNNSMNQIHAYELELNPPKNGERNGNATLTEEDVLHIWQVKMTATEVANTYGLNKKYAQRLINKNTWTHLIS